MTLFSLSLSLSASRARDRAHPSPCAFLPLAISALSARAHSTYRFSESGNTGFRDRVRGCNIVDASSGSTLNAPARDATRCWGGFPKTVASCARARGVESSGLGGRPSTFGSLFKAQRSLFQTQPRLFSRQFPIGLFGPHHVLNPGSDSPPLVPLTQP